MRPRPSSVCIAAGLSRGILQRARCYGAVTPRRTSLPLCQRPAFSMCMLAAWGRPEATIDDIMRRPHFLGFTNCIPLAEAHRAWLATTGTMAFPGKEPKIMLGTTLPRTISRSQLKSNVYYFGDTMGRWFSTTDVLGTPSGSAKATGAPSSKRGGGY